MIAIEEKLVRFKMTFLFCIISFCFYGQNQEIVGDLLKKLETQTEDTLMINTLNDLAWELGKSDAQKATAYAKKAMGLSNSLQYERGRITSLNRLGNIAIYQKEFNRAEKLFLEALEAEKAQNYIYGIARAQNQLGIIYRKKGNLNESLRYSLEALKNFQSLGKENLISLGLNNTAITYQELGNYKRAMDYYLKSLEIKKKGKNKKSLGFSYLDIGTLYIAMEDYQKAIEHLKESQAIFSTLNDFYELSKVHNNLGIAYYKLGKDSKAQSHYETSLDLKKQVGIAEKDPRVYNNLGAIYYRKNELDKALTYYNKSLSIELKNQNAENHSETLNNIGNIFFEKRVFSKAASFYQKAYFTAQSSGNRIVELQTANNLSLVYAKLKQYDSAYFYNKEYSKFSDSLQVHYKEVINIKAKYEKEQNQKALLEKDNKRKSLLINALTIGVLLSIILFFAILRGNKQKQKAILAEKNRQIEQQKVEELLKNQELKSINAMIEGQEGERQRIAQDLHDRLGSMLSMVKVHFKSVEDYIKDLQTTSNEQYHKANQILDNACEEVRKISHDMASGVLSNFGLVAALEDLKNTLQSIDNFKVEFIAHGMDNRLDSTIELGVYRIVQELISNILKHAQAKEITIQLIRTENNLNLIVEDNGIGFDVNEHQLSGMGLKNVSSRVASLKGELQIDAQPHRGTTISIDFPLKTKLL